MIQIIIAITTTTAITPTMAPALNMPPITAQLLRAIKSIENNTRFNVFMMNDSL